MHKTIFITIPSYEDPDLVKTIDGALSNASYPQNLFFAVALQYKNIPLPDIGGYYKNPNIKFISYDVDTRPGVVQVRHDLLNLHDGQDYVLMLDSHMTFIKGWDEILVIEHENICKDTDNNRVIISQTTGPTAEVTCDCFYTQDICEKPHRQDIFKIDNISVHRTSFTKQTHNLHRLDRDKAMVATNTNKNYDPSMPTPAGFFFTSCKWIIEVGIVDGVHITGEEPLLAFRSFLAGWDVYVLKNIAVIGHNPRNYNIAVYGRPNPKKLYSRVRDEYSVSVEVEQAMIFNLGRFAVRYPKRRPEKFWQKIGLGKEYELLKNNVLKIS